LAFGLLGLNSLDAIVQDETAYVLEVNPRLSATIDLYENTADNLIDRHIQVCLGRCGLNQVQRADERQAVQSKAHAIVYAIADMEIMPSFKWPDEWLDWAVDIPDHSKRVINIPAGAPICSVVAYAENAQTAKQLAQARVELVQNLLKCSTTN